MQRNTITMENPNLSVAEEMEKDEIKLSEFYAADQIEEIMAYQAKPKRYKLATKSGSITLYDFQLSNFIYGMESNLEMLRSYGDSPVNPKIIGWIEDELNQLKAAIAQRVAKDGGLKS